MESLPKLAWSLVGTALFLGLVYFIFQDNRVFDIILPSNVFGAEIKLGVENARDKIYSVINPIVSPVINQVKKTTGAIYDTAKDEVENLISKTKASAIDSVKNVINDKIDNIAEDVGIQKKSNVIPLNDANLAQDFPLGFTLKVNSPTVFVVKDVSKNNQPISYLIDWGDSVKEEGEVPSSSTRPVHHAWIEAGEYRVKVTINDNGLKKLFSVFVVVY